MTVILGPKDPDSVEFFKFDYIHDNRFETGETITSASISVTVVRGKDPNADNLLSGAVAISGLTVSQLIVGGVVGVVYALKCLATTSNSQILDCSGEVEIQDV